MKFNTKKLFVVAAALPLFLGATGTAFGANYSQAKLTWLPQPQTRCYRIFYKESASSNWQFAVHCKDLKAPVNNYTVMYLKPATSYTYNVQAVGTDADRHTWWLGPDKTMTEEPQQ